MYCLGILLVDLMKGRSSETLEVKDDAKKGQISVSHETRELIALLLNLDAETRIPLTEVRNHPIFSFLRPSSFKLLTRITEEGVPDCKLKMFRIDPQRKNFCLCLRVKHAESSDREKEFDEIYLGYIDGSIILVKIWPNSSIEVQDVLKSKRPNCLN